MTVAIGQSIPEYAIPATSGLTFTPASAQGKKLVIYFYPKDMTPGCTAESGEFRDNIEAFTKANTLIVGVSRDSLAIRRYGFCLSKINCQAASVRHSGATA